MGRIAEVIAARGGPGSGNFGHGGRPGEVGGSSDEGGSGGGGAFVSASGHSASQLSKMNPDEIRRVSRGLSREQILTDLKNLSLKNNLDTITNKGVLQEIHSAILHSYSPYADQKLLTGVFILKPGAESTTKEVAFNSYGQFHRGTKEIGLNEKFFGNPGMFQDSLDEGMDSMFHPEGCNTLKSVVDHEIGHALELASDKNGEPLKNLYKTYIGRPGAGVSQLTSHLSKYATKNVEEFIAEGWAESKNSYEPRPLSLKISSLLEARLK